MVIKAPRVTRNVLAVMAALLADEPLHGLALTKATGLASGTIYPILERLERAGWVTGEWEVIDPAVEKRPRRRNYTLSGEGNRVARREIYAARAQLRGATSWRPEPSS
jgi:PadR family transcriptional regulator, regulatory protein PadR